MDNEIVVIAGPYILKQVLWYYSANPREDLIAVIIPYGDGDISKKIEEYCKKSGLFKKIIVSEVSYYKVSLFKKMTQFLSMFFCWVSFRKRKYSEKVIKENIGNISYSSAVLSNDYSMLGGAFMQVLPKGKLVMLEDGSGDYQERRNKPSFDLYGIVGYLIAKMGYMNVYVGKGSSYYLNTTKKCIKYSSFPEEMIYREYSDIRTLFQKNNCCSEYENLIEKVFGDSFAKDFEESDIVLYTAPMDDFGIDFDYEAVVHKWFLENMKDKKIFLKKHPRDNKKYDWKDIDIRCGCDALPGEILATCSKDKESYFLFPSTILLTMPVEDRHIKVFKFSDIKTEWYITNFYNRLMKVQEDEIINC